MPATGATAVLLNATVTEATGPGWLSIFPAGSARPLPSDLNHATAETRPNLVVVALGTEGKISVYTQAGTQVMLDVAGWVS